MSEQVPSKELGALLTCAKEPSLTNAAFTWAHIKLMADEIDRLQRELADRPALLDGLSIQQWKAHAKAGWKMYAARAENEPFAGHPHQVCSCGAKVPTDTYVLHTCGDRLTPKPTPPPAPTLPEYTHEIGEAGEQYLKSVSLDGQYYLSGTFRWHELWEAMGKAAGLSSSETKGGEQA